VGSGLTIDGKGRALNIYEPQVKILDYRRFKLPANVYVTISYNEILDEFYQNKENPEFQGYKKKIETAVVELTSEIPDNITHMEIARIYLEEDENGEIKEIKEPDDFTRPEPNEIDTRFVMWAAVAKGGLSPYLKEYLIDIMEKTRTAAASASDVINLYCLRDLQTASLIGKMIVQCGDIDQKDIIHVLHPIYDINTYIIQEMLDYERKEKKRHFSTKESFQTLTTRVHEMSDLVKYYDNKLETLDKIFKCQEDIIASLKNIVAAKRITFEDIEISSADMPRVLIVEDYRYMLVDYIDLTDDEIVKNKELSHINNKDYSVSRHSFIYPDSVEVFDAVLRCVGGEVSFKINNLIKRKELVMIRRTDIFHGDYSVDIHLDDNQVQKLLVDGNDTKYRWRNLHVRFHEDLITESSLKLTFKLSESGRDNFGKIWFYQRL
jgi:hypothetical protein